MSIFCSGGVFAIAFLSVLCAFACGAIMLKLYRAKLARMVIAQWWQIFVSLAAVFVGLIGKEVELLFAISTALCFLVLILARCHIVTSIL